MNRGRKYPVYPLTLGFWPEAPAQKLKSGAPEHPKAAGISRQLINYLGLCAAPLLGPHRQAAPGHTARPCHRAQLFY